MAGEPGATQLNSFPGGRRGSLRAVLGREGPFSVVGCRPSAGPWGGPAGAVRGALGCSPRRAEPSRSGAERAGIPLLSPPSSFVSAACG